MHSTIDPIVLCGGGGTRLRSVTGDIPKPMALVAGRPFLEFILRQLQGAGFQRAVLATGYRHEVIQGHFRERAFGLDLCYSIEQTPLGTGGAVRQALGLVQSESVLVLNGDSYTNAGLRELAADHAGTGADVTMAVVPSDGRDDAGNVIVDGAGAVVSFSEKSGPAGVACVNAGIYAIGRRLVEALPQGVGLSLETQVLPGWLAERRDVRAFAVQGPCVDIGIPERYQAAQRLLAHLAL
ncbi:MAG: nucleotidyltransferase family protein [Bryobacterales bacterium]|nr:nucleotidyltransferase family protein [Bryobacterales bacterium]